MDGSGVYGKGKRGRDMGRREEREKGRETETNGERARG